MGDWWYLMFSTFTDRFVTQYRMSRSIEGPWRAPAVDTFDGRAFYAAKSATDGRRRYLFGWNPTRTKISQLEPARLCTRLQHLIGAELVARAVRA
jgi:beta-fructofuranosidase